MRTRSSLLVAAALLLGVACGVKSPVSPVDHEEWTSQKSVNVPCPQVPMEVFINPPYTVTVTAHARAMVKSWQVSDGLPFRLLAHNKIRFTAHAPGTYNAIAHVDGWEVCGIAIVVLPA